MTRELLAIPIIRAVVGCQASVSRRWFVKSALALPLACAPVSVTAKRRFEPPPASFNFGDIPEIVFLAGFAQQSQLGIFQFDTANRWTPGDLDRTLPSHRTGLPWTSTVETRLVDATTFEPVSDPFVTYDWTTGELSCSATDPGVAAHDLNVCLEAKFSGPVRLLSPPFRIRVLRARAVYGAGASTNSAFGYLAAGAKFDSSLGATFSQARQYSNLGGGSDATPGVLVHLGGVYATEDRFCGQRRFFYLLGEPGNRPRLNNSVIAFAQTERFYIKNLELANCRINESGWQQNTGSETYITEVYQHDQTVYDNGIANPNGLVPASRPRRFWVWNFRGALNGSPDNTRHQMYIEGRPYLTLYVNNIHIDGARGCSIVKTTAQNVGLWNSDLSSVNNETNPAGDTSTSGSLCKAATIVFDVPAACNIIAYNNRVALYSDTEGGLQAGCFFWRARKPGMNASDIPRYPDIDYDAGTSTQTTYSAPPGWPADVSTFKNDEFWATVSSKAATDETNTLTFKHYVAFNQFELLPGSNNARVLRDDGTHPVEEVEQFGMARILPTHLNWSERSVTFLANNRYTGFSGNPRFAMTDYDRVAEVETTATQGAPKWRTDLSAPGNGREVPGNFLQFGGVPNVFGQTGGELVGAGTFTPVALPTWFKVARLQ